MRVFSFVAVVFLFLPGGLFGQADRYVVFFKNKTNTPFSIDQPGDFLSSRAIARRAGQHIPINETDLPVNPAYISEVRNTGARTFFSSRWMNCVLIEVGADSIGLIQSLPMVSGVELAAPGHKLAGGRTKKLSDRQGTGGTAGAMEQLEQLGLDLMHSQGFHGEHVAIAVLDAGFPGVNIAAPFQHLHDHNQIKGTFDFVGNTGSVYQYNEHGTEVLSIIAADIPGAFTGGATEADFYLYVTEDTQTEYRIEEYNWLFAAEKADSSGADIISTSLGYNRFDDASMNYDLNDLDGETAVVTRAAKQAMLSGMVVVCSAGNEAQNDWHFVTPPADAAGILAVGATGPDGTRAPFSSVGPTADGRIKPDVVAKGVATSAIEPGGAIIIGDGTSFACPLITSLVAGVWQAFPGVTVEKLYGAIIKSGDQANAPDNKRGYGLPNFIGVKNILETADIHEDITIHPNPAPDGVVTITFKQPANEPCTITLFDCMGRVLSMATISLVWQNNPFQLSLYGISPGIYFVQFRSQSVSRTLKLIKA